MHFLPPPLPREPQPRRDEPVWRWLLFASAVAAALGSTLPWVRVRFATLFGDVEGPPGWHSSAGFTCLCSSALVLVMALAESGSPASRLAVRPGSLLLAAITALAVGLEWQAGPGLLRGVSARWTACFYLVVASLPLLVAACGRRWLAATGDAPR
ncbi:MAG: hypothetical protein KF830_07685 [Planctomycetes bacterium]|nr:hypothetical protein [Planctomycetota bacterium]